MKYAVLTLLLLFTLVSCNKEEKSEKENNIKEVPVKEPIVVEFGFTLNDFLVVNDTVKSGDTFGTLMDKHNLGKYKVHEITEKARDSFNFRDIRAGRPYTILKTKTAPNTVQVFIYQPDNIHYNVIDLRDSIVAYRNKKPITIKRRTIATEIESSLSETLSKAGVDASLAQNLADIYAYSVDFLQNSERR